MTTELLTVSEAARWAKVSESFLNKARLDGSGPRFLRLGRAIRYRLEDLESWAAAYASSVPGAAFRDKALRAAIVREMGEPFAASYLDPGNWDAAARTLSPKTEVSRRKLCDPKVKEILTAHGVTIADAPGEVAPREEGVEA